jgi:hypothetical protein
MAKESYINIEMIQVAVVVYCSFSSYNKKGLFFDYRIEGG